MAVPAWTPTDPVEKMPNLQPPINWCPAPPKVVSTDVFPYQANEVAISTPKLVISPRTSSSPAQRPATPYVNFFLYVILV